MRTANERMDAGRAARQQVKRSAHAAWDPTRRTEDPVDVLVASNRERVSKLVPIKMARMATSPFGFFRGNVPLMALDLSTVARTSIVTQLCGDAHVRNLGAFTAPDGRLAFDLNDFDETIPGPWEWDVKRLATSLVLAGREAGQSEAACRDAVQTFIGAYRIQMREFTSMPAVEIARYHIHHAFDRGPGAAVLSKARRATPLHSLKTLTEEREGQRVFKELRPILSRVSAETASVVRQALARYRRGLAPWRRHIFDFYELADVHFKVVGTGSVGTRDYVVLCHGHGPSDPLFLQVKQALPSAYARYLNASARTGNQGRRVAEGQQRMQTQSDLLLGWTAFGGHDYLVRQLADHKGGIEDRDLAGGGLRAYARMCGLVLAKGHARSGDAWLLAGYLGVGPSFDQAIERFAVAYADQVTRDHGTFKRAIRRGTIKASPDPYL